MFTKFASMTAALALGAVAVTFTAQPATAGANEYFKCSLAEGKTMDDLVSVASHFYQVLFRHQTGNLSLGRLRARCRDHRCGKRFLG